MVFVVSNPVAHGARLAKAVQKWTAGSAVLTVADARFADPSLQIDAGFPGISARSLAPISSLRNLAFALHLRRRLPSGELLRGSSNCFYREYLFVAQAIRYRTLFSEVGNLSPSTVALADFDRAAYSRPWIWAAESAGLVTAMLVHGSPTVANYVPLGLLKV
ncbi:MAG: hypothetical protein H7288_09220 [Kineosporiaceae bacterium]|nr:hypothetical protein [Aeromicrobium sp.]